MEVLHSAAPRTKLKKSLQFSPNSRSPPGVPLSPCSSGEAREAEGASTAQCPAERTDDAHVALQHMREAVLGSIHGSKRHARKCILFEVDPGEGVAKDPLRLAHMRLELLGARNGTPPRCRTLRLPEDLDDKPAQSHSHGEASPEAAGRDAPPAHPRPRHGRRESCPSAPFFTGSPSPAGTPHAGAASRFYPRAQSCDSKGAPAEPRGITSGKVQAASAAAAWARRPAPAGVPAASLVAVSDPVLATDKSGVPGLEEGWCQGFSSPKLLLPPKSPAGCRMTVQTVLEEGSSAGLSVEGLQSATPGRSSKTSQKLTRRGRPVEFTAPPLIPAVAQSDPLLLTCGIAEDLDWCQELQGSPPEGRSALQDLLNSSRAARSSEQAETPGGSQHRGAPTMAEGGRANDAAMKVLKGDKALKAGGTWARLFRHSSVDAQSSRKKAASPGRWALRRQGVEGLGARMTPDQHAREYYSTEP